jgi:hypothetical protein
MSDVFLIKNTTMSSDRLRRISMNVVGRTTALRSYCRVAGRKKKAATLVCDEVFKEFKFHKQFKKTADMTVIRIQTE